eukprot:4458706-Karenia_brevis.AAC.1
MATRPGFVEDDWLDHRETKRCLGHPARAPKNWETFQDFVHLLQESGSSNPAFDQAAIIIFRVEPHQAHYGFHALNPLTN